MKKISLLLMLFSLFTLAHCGGMSTSSKVKYPNPVSSEAKNDFNQAERLFENEKYSEADKLYKAYVKNYPYNELTDKSEFRTGQVAMLKQNYGQAIAIFKNLIKKTPSLEVKAKSNLKLALSYYRVQKNGEALAALGSIEEKYLDDREKAKMGTLALKILNKEDYNRKAYYLAVLTDVYEGRDDASIQKDFGKDSPSKNEVNKQFQEWVKLATPIEAVERRLIDYKGKSSAASLEFKLGKSYFESKNQAKAKEHLKRYVSKYSKHAHIDEANRMLATLGSVPVEKTVNKNAIKVGVILPLSGKLELYGNYTLKGMECAAQVRPECKSGASNVELIIKDSMGDPQKSAHLVEELEKEKVAVILGPLPSAEVDNAAAKAKELGIPLIALSQKKGIPALGENVFRFSLTPASQTKAILKYLSNHPDQKKLALFYPNNNYGQEFLSEFEDLAPNYGVTLAAKQGYSPVKPDVSEDLRQLKLKSPVAEAGDKRFDSIFIPDSYQNMGNIAAAFVKAELNGYTVLGTNAWNDASLPSKFNNSLSSGLFVDLFFKDSPKEISQTFVREFQAAYAYFPSSLEAMGYDIVRFVSFALASSKGSNKDQVKSSLQKSNYDGVTGLKGFNSNREAEVDALLISVDKDGFKELSKN